MKLREIGERQITEGLVGRACPLSGDDCCFVNAGAHDIAVTTDPVPPPAALVIGGDPDPYWAGWLLVTINLSDLAAAGATPLAFVAAIELPAEAERGDLERVLAGISDACVAEGVAYGGGNLRESKAFSATGSAVGTVEAGKGLRRKGGRSGDRIFSVGRGGKFWRDALRWRAGERFAKKSSNLFAPQSQVRSMQVVARSAAIACSMDNSDGLLATLEQLSRANHLTVELDLRALAVDGTAATPLEQARLWLGWGDWNVVVAAHPQEAETLVALSAERGIDLAEIGRFGEAGAGVRFGSGRGATPAPRLESERFAADSWFSEGIEGYVRRLLTLPLPD